MYLLDTDIISNFLYRPETYPYLVEKIKTVEPNTIFISWVTASEMFNGRLQALVQQRNQKYPQIVEAYHYVEEMFKDIGRFQLVSFGDAEYREFIRIPGHVRGGINDKRIAATALAHNLTLVTANVQHFQGIPNLMVEDWTARPLE